MKTGRPAILAICICLLLAPLAAYELGGESAPTTNCNDGVDNDFDNKADGDDPGCSKPYYQDDSEANIFDLDVTNVFADIQPGDSASTIKSKLVEGPSIYYGWNVTSPDKVSATYWPDTSFTTSDGTLYINETWVEGSKKQYGGGNLTWTEIDITGLAISTSRNSGHAEVIDAPAPETSNSCGTGKPGPGSGTQTERENCPEDYGMRSQIKLDDSLDSYGSQSSVYYDVGWSNSMKCYELTDSSTSSKTVDITDDTSDVTVNTAGTNGGGPDYSIKKGSLFSSTDEHALMEISCTTSGAGTTEIATKTNRKVESKDRKVRGSELTQTLYTSGTSPVTACTSWSETDTYETYTASQTYSMSPDTVKAGEDSSGGAKDASSSRSVDVTVKWTDTRVDSGNSFYKCTGTSTYYESCSGTCLKVQGTVYGVSTKSKAVNPKDDNTITVSYQNYDLTSSEIYNTQNKNDAFSTIVGSSDSPYSTSNFNFYSNAIHTDFTDDGKDQGNSHAISRNKYKLTVGSSSDDFLATRESSTNIDVDGPRGFADGFIAIDDGSIAGSTNKFLQTEIKDGSEGSYLSKSMVGNQLTLSCPGDSTKCVASVDVYPKNHDSWTSSNPGAAVGFRLTDEGPHNLSDSYGATKMYMALTDDHEVTECTGDDCNDGGGTITDEDDDNPVCGDETGERYIFMEGPEIDEQKMDSEDASTYGKCIDTSRSDLSGSACNFKNDPVTEGYVGNVAPDHTTLKFEEGGNSPDMEVCLDLQGTGIGDEGDEVAGDNQQDDVNQEDYGGEWYDLDSETAQQYLRGVEDGTYSTESGDQLVSDGDSSDPNDIAYYWNSQINPPQESQYNPQGGREGTALEDDCGNSRFDGLKCDDQNNINDRGHGSTNTFFSFFQEGLNDEDVHPQGGSSEDITPLSGFAGTINRLQSISNQLQPSMDTNAYEDSEYSKWEDTRGGQYADVWSMSLYLNWSVDSTGTPYPPYSTWYRSWSDRRTSPDSNSVEKMQKAFGNSYSAVANESFTYTNADGSTVQVDKGDGVWIDPDQMKTIGEQVNLTPESVDPGVSEWRAALSMQAPESSLNNGFKIDISGQDAGLGVNVNSNFECLSSREDGGCKVVAENVEYEKDDSGNVMGELEKPMCGDDRHEYLIEQAGASGSSKQYTGPYACATSLNSCYDSTAPEGEKIVDQDGYRDVNEPRESEGRLKDDREICQKISGQDDYALWYDQDYRESFCNQNTLYGKEGSRWFDAQYVADHPQAVRGGIDDSWNDYLGQQGHDNYTSDTTATASEVTVGGDITPVSTGTFENVTATLGFCGGDDESEYIVTQECNTRYCETDRSVQGVAKVPGSCVLRGSGGTYETSNSERSIYRPGEQVEITGVSGNPTIACFNGAWFADWPVNFNEQQIQVPLGETRTASFDIVNIRNTETTFRVTMEQNSASPSADQFAQFVSQSGDSFTTTIKPTSSKTFRIEFTGGNENLDIGDPGSTLTIRAEGINSGLVGSDSVEVGIEPASNIASGETGQTRDVPGIKTVQLIAMMLLSTLVFFTRRRS